MAEEIIGTMIIVAVVIITIAAVFVLGKPIIENAGIGAKLDEAESALKTIENNVYEVVDEGPGSSRVFTVNVPGEITKKENTLQFQIKSPKPVFDYFSRSFVTDSITRISENDARCYAAENIVMENSRIRVELQRVVKTNPLQEINTKNNIASILQKDSGSIIRPSDTSIFIDALVETRSGNGYSELMAEGPQPVCIAHFFVDSSLDYDIYYKLYSGADFLVVEVRNIA